MFPSTWKALLTSIAALAALYLTDYSAKMVVAICQVVVSIPFLFKEPSASKIPLLKKKKTKNRRNRHRGLKKYSRKRKH